MRRGSTGVPEIDLEVIGPETEHELECCVQNQVRYWNLNWRMKHEINSSHPTGHVFYEHCLQFWDPQFKKGSKENIVNNSISLEMRSCSPKSKHCWKIWILEYIKINYYKAGNVQGVSMSTGKKKIQKHMSKSYEIIMSPPSLSLPPVPNLPHFMGCVSWCKDVGKK